MKSQYIISVSVFWMEETINPNYLPVGLSNPGALCYLISSLQQLFAIPLFKQLLYNNPLFCNGKFLALLNSIEQHGISRNNLLIECFIELNTKSNFDNEKSIICGINQQRDLVECFSQIFSKLQKFTGCKDIAHFHGQLLNVLRSISSAHKLEKNERFLYISLPLGNGKEKSLQLSLNAFTSEENLNYPWDATSKAIPTSKRSYFSSLPTHLFFQIRRFDYDFIRQTPIKRHDRFEFPKILDMKPYTLDGFEAATIPYRLSGVVVHSGKTMFDGHYYSYVRSRSSTTSHPVVGVASKAGSSDPMDAAVNANNNLQDVDGKINNRWYIFDDDYVALFDETEIDSCCYGVDDNHSDPMDPVNHVDDIKESSTNQNKFTSAVLLIYDKMES